MRSIDEQVKDMLLELFLLQEASPYGEMDSRMKVQKLHFICQKQMTESATKGLTLVFFTYNRGPYSKLLANDLRALQRLGFIGRDHRLTDRGKAILDRYRETLERKPNSEVVGEIMSVLKEHGHLSALELEKLTHKMPIKPVWFYAREPVLIENLPPHIDLLVPLDESESKIEFQLTDEELETLQLSFCWDEEHLEEMRLSSSKTYEQIFDGV